MVPRQAASMEAERRMASRRAGLFYVFVCHNYSSNIHYYNYMEKKRTHELKFDEKTTWFSVLSGSFLTSFP